MVCVNCAAIPATLIESELFGREKGAYTDAIDRQIGRFELADRSTIFLDEIGDLLLEVQVKLLRVHRGAADRAAGQREVDPVNTRIIAATHRSLEQRIDGRRVPRGLFYRLNVFPIRVPPLRERAEDIPLLVWRFIEEFSKTFGKRSTRCRADNMAALQRHSWPGNIRELRNAVERAMILATGPRLTIADSGAVDRGTLRAACGWSDMQRDHIRKVLETAGWRVRGTEWRGGPAWTAAHHARNPDGEAGAQRGPRRRELPPSPVQGER